jgi:hypothetical protein
MCLFDTMKIQNRNSADLFVYYEVCPVNLVDRWHQNKLLFNIDTNLQ